MRITRLCKFGFKYLEGHKPEGVGLILTRRCNLDCSYCKIKDNSGKKNELTTREWKTIIDRFIENKHMHFIFTGGEPLLYDGLFELIDHTSKKAATSLITNTLLLDDGKFAKLKNLDYLTFSCDTSHRNKRLTKNTMNRFKKIADNSKRYGIKPSAILTVTSKNTEEIIPMIKEASRYDIPVLLSLIHSDQGKYDFRGYTPALEFRNEEELGRLRRLQNRLIRLKKNGYKISESKDFIRNMETYAKREYVIDCPATKPFFTIDCDGYIKPCHDIKASRVNALDFDDYEKMKEDVARTVPKNCNCYYDCYVGRNNSRIDLVRRVLRR
ncbi:MAG: radical SAM protein [Candidatus Woesearchaeota archaeon]